MNKHVLAADKLQWLVDHGAFDYQQPAPNQMMTEAAKTEVVTTGWRSFFASKKVRKFLRAVKPFTANEPNFSRMIKTIAGTVAAFSAARGELVDVTDCAGSSHSFFEHTAPNVKDRFMLLTNFAELEEWSNLRAIVLEWGLIEDMPYSNVRFAFAATLDIGTVFIVTVATGRTSGSIGLNQCSITSKEGTTADVNSAEHCLSQLLGVATLTGEVSTKHTPRTPGELAEVVSELKELNKALRAHTTRRNRQDKL